MPPCPTCVPTVLSFIILLRLQAQQSAVVLFILNLDKLLLYEPIVEPSGMWLETPLCLFACLLWYHVYFSPFIHHFPRLKCFQFVLPLPLPALRPNLSKLWSVDQIRPSGPSNPAIKLWDTLVLEQNNCNLKWSF